MDAKRFQGRGSLAGWVAAAAALATLSVVLMRVPEPVEESSERDSGPDPVAALTEDVRALREDLRGLARALETSFGALSDELDGRAGERERQRAETLARDLAALRAAVDAARSETTAVRAALASNAALPAFSADEPEPVAAIEPSPSTPHLAPEPATAAPAAAKRGFLSFQLPSEAFAFDRLTRFAIVPSLSRVGFDAISTLHDFSGVTSRVEGELTACLARPAEGCAGTVTVDAVSLDTGIDERDENMRESLATERFAELRFVWTRFEPAAVDAGAQKLSGLAHGRMTIHGIERDFDMPVEISVDESRRMSIRGQAKLDLTTFEVPVPSQLGLISMENEVTVWIALCARPLGPALAEGQDATVR